MAYMLLHSGLKNLYAKKIVFFKVGQKHFTAKNLSFFSKAAQKIFLFFKMSHKFFVPKNTRFFQSGSKIFSWQTFLCGKTTKKFCGLPKKNYARFLA